MEGSGGETSLVNAWLDLSICIAYISIPIQLVFVATREVTAIDFRKITGNMTTSELAVSRTLLFVFALFILCCGFGHGISALKALNGSDNFFTVMQTPMHIMTAVVSIAASLFLAVSLPKLLGFCNSIEIHRKGYLKLALEEKGQSADIVDKEFPFGTRKTSGSDLGDKSDVDVKKPKRSLSSLSNKIESKVAHGLQTFSDDIQELRALPNLLGKCVSSPRPELNRLSKTQILQLLAATYVLHKDRPRWGTHPDETWGDFSLVLKRIVRKKLARNSGIPLELWMDICQWCASMTSDQLSTILETVLAFESSAKPQYVVKLADMLGGESPAGVVECIDV